MSRYLWGMAVCLVVAVSVFAVGCKKEEPAAPIEVPKGIAQLPPYFDSEIKKLEDIVAREPKNYDALVKLGNIYMDAQSYNEAISAYSRALQVNDKDQNVRVDMGTCYRNINRPDMAVEVYRKAIAMDPKHPFAHMNLGIVLAYDFGKHDEAIKELEMFVKLAPNHPQVSTIKQEIERIKAELSKK